MKLKSLKNVNTINKKELIYIAGGNSSSHSKKRDTSQTDSNRADGTDCTPPHGQQ